MNHCLWIASGLAALFLAGCAKQPIHPFEPGKIQRNERLAPAGIAPINVGPLPATLPAVGQGVSIGKLSMSTVPPGTERPVVTIALEEAVQRAILNNYDIRVAAYEPAIEQTRATEAEARFDPEFFANIEAQDQSNVNLALPTFGQFNDSNQFVQSEQFQTGIRQNLESGGQAEFRFGTQQIDRDAASSFTTNPYWLNDLTVELTQPLLRDFGYDVNQARIRIARNQRQVSLLEFRQNLEETLENIERTYWQLLQARRELDVARSLLERTEQTVDLLRERGRVDVNRLQISQANSSAAIRRALVVRAESRVAELSDQLKQLMNDPEFPIAGPTLLLPATPALQQPVVFSLQDQVQTALTYRPELGQQQLRIDSATEASGVAQNNMLPRLNLVAAGSLQVAGDGFVSAFEDNNGNPDSDFYDNWSLGLQFSVPIGNRAARSVMRRATLQRQQAIDSYRGLVERISLEVKNALREVETSWNEIIHTREARYLAADALAAIQERENAREPLTAEFVQLKLDRQAALAQAESTEAQSITNYNQAISRLERAKGTLLKFNNVEIAEELLPGRL